MNRDVGPRVHRYGDTRHRLDRVAEGTGSYRERPAGRAFREHVLSACDTSSV
ncbi:hypothetical protein [Halorubrum salsamenti]|uniref:hypothetical protein n=1 Tax=Halorubrum salsamenti TaxID=2583990 RepID=UPI001642A625|nr:hypothetical protein [Halorubrum salsamenti]